MYNAILDATLGSFIDISALITTTIKKKKENKNPCKQNHSSERNSTKSQYIIYKPKAEQNYFLKKIVVAIKNNGKN